jgi:SpoVK/Ycf46/Vps4 family AAA+-type ATPase
MSAIADILALRRKRLDAVLRSGDLAHPALSRASRFARQREADGLVLLPNREEGLDVDAVSESKATATFTVSVVSQDRSGDVVRPAGCRKYLDSYRANNVISYNHLTQAVEMPIASAGPGEGPLSWDIAADRITSTAHFHLSTELSEQAFELVTLKVLKGASLGFIPHLARRLDFAEPQGGMSRDEVSFDFPGFDFTEWEVVEWAVCFVPCNRETVSMVLGKNRLAGRQIAEPLAKGMEPYRLRRRLWQTGDSAKDGATVKFQEDDSPAFDISNQDLRPSSVVYDFVARHLGVQIKEVYESATHVPAAKLGGFLSAWEEETAPFKKTDVRNINGSGSESPPRYEVIRLNSEKTRDFLVDGLVFLEGPFRAVAELSKSWYGLGLTLYTRADERQRGLDLLDKTWTATKERHNYLKGEAFALSGEFLPKTGETWQDIFLPEKITRQLSLTLKQLNDRQEKFANRGTIFLGPPGTGKTLSGRVLRNEVDATFVWISTADFYRSGAFGGFSYAFELARELSPTVLFFEDVDHWLDSYSVDLLKTEMDGIGRYKGVWTILTTNFPERLPEALIDRPGRFHDVLNFGLPDDAIRRAMIGKWLPELAGSDLAAAVSGTAGYSGAHVYELCHFARVLHEEEGKDFPTAVVEALEKVKEQRRLIASTSAGSGLRRRALPDQLASYAKGRTWRLLKRQGVISKGGESYFGECPRDEAGHCKPSGQGDEGGSGKEKPSTGGSGSSTSLADSAVSVIDQAREYDSISREQAVLAAMDADEDLSRDDAGTIVEELVHDGYLEESRNESGETEYRVGGGPADFYPEARDAVLAGVADAPDGELNWEAAVLYATDTEDVDRAQAEQVIDGLVNTGRLVEQGKDDEGRPIVGLPKSGQGDESGSGASAPSEEEATFGSDSPDKGASVASGFLASMESAFDGLDAGNASESAEKVDHQFEAMQAAVNEHASGFYEHFSTMLTEELGDYVEDLAPQAAEDFHEMTQALASDLNYAINQARESFLAYANAVEEGEDDEVQDSLINEFRSNLEACQEAAAEFPRLMQERFDEAHDTAFAEAPEQEEEKRMGAVELKAGLARRREERARKRREKQGEQSPPAAQQQPGQQQQEQQPAPANGEAIQAVLCPKATYATPEEAASYVQQTGLDASDMEDAGDAWAFIQFEPADCQPETARREALDDGCEVVYCTQTSNPKSEKPNEEAPPAASNGEVKNVAGKNGTCARCADKSAISENGLLKFVTTLIDLLPAKVKSAVERATRKEITNIIKSHDRHETLAQRQLTAFGKVGDDEKTLARLKDLSEAAAATGGSLTDKPQSGKDDAQQDKGCPPGVTMTKAIKAAIDEHGPMQEHPPIVKAIKQTVGVWRKASADYREHDFGWPKEEGESQDQDGDGDKPDKDGDGEKPDEDDKEKEREEKLLSDALAKLNGAFDRTAGEFFKLTGTRI